IKFPIRLEGLASRYHNFSSYEPELFPGLIYRMAKAISCIFNYLRTQGDFYERRDGWAIAGRLDRENMRDSEACQRWK
ncbi:hypothetical protein F5883DRAFT_441789, partial [Diaporthe sp. PMI_573]